MTGELRFPTRQRYGVTPTVTDMSQDRIDVTPVAHGKSTKTSIERLLRWAGILRMRQRDTDKPGLAGSRSDESDAALETLRDLRL